MVTDAPKPPFFALPGFFPDAIPYALRTSAALLLAYGVAFYAQLPSASSAGITVGIIAQSSSGMALSKAYYRVLGTIIGCGVSILFGAAFGQDRTMLLFSFALWMGLCSAVATILRDFRSYGAAISGYTVAIIAIGGIDEPEGLFLASLNRTGAILIGIAAVALVNSLFGGAPAQAGLVTKLSAERGKVADFALDALEGRPIDDDLTITRRVAAITGLQTDATYAAAEQRGGRRRRQGAQVAIGSLLTAISAGRTIAGVLSPETPAPIRDYLRRAAVALREGAPMPPAPATTDPFDGLLIERTQAILRRVRDADGGIAVLKGGEAVLPDVVLRPTHDYPAAFLSAVRTIIAFGLTAAFGVLAGWPGSTLMLIQQAAFVGLLGANPTPTIASKGFIIPLFPIALIIGLVEFLVLPLTSGFVPFALVVGGIMFLTALLTRLKRLAPLAPAALIYVTLLLAPANPQTFDLAAYLNTTVLLFLATLFTLLSFLLILPVSPKRRLFRVITAVGKELQVTLHSNRPMNPAVAQARLYDRLVRALTFLGRPTGARKGLLSRIYRMGVSDIAVHRARTGLDALARTEGVSDQVSRARQALNQNDRPGMVEAARALLATPDLWPGIPAQQAVSGLAELAYQQGDRQRVNRFIRLVTG